MASIRSGQNASVAVKQPSSDIRLQVVEMNWRDLKWEFLTGLVLFAGGRLTNL
jgi:hypothetical protein